MPTADVRLPDIHLPDNATVDRSLLEAIAEACARLDDPEQSRAIWKVDSLLYTVRDTARYDAAQLLARELVFRHADALKKTQPAALLRFINVHGTREQRLYVAGRLRRDRDAYTRRLAQQALAGLGHPDSGYLEPAAPLKGRRLDRHPSGRDVLAGRGLPPLETVAELRELLEIPSPGQLGYLLANAEGGPYFSFTVKKSDGSDRTIQAPNRQLRRVQRHILRQILDKVPPHEAAHGFVAGRSTVTNAAAHVGRAVLVKFDLTDFFNTVRYWRVVGLFASLGYRASPAWPSTDDDARQIAPNLARLCTVGDPDWMGDAQVPQGAPTSPAICNLVCRSLDARLSGLAASMGGTYTRYADDITISFADDPGAALGRLRWWVETICTQEGFQMNQRKFRIVRQTQRQVVTGVVVNQTLRVPRTERRRFRAILHNCRTHGVASQARGRPRFEDWLRGYAAYIHMVHPDEGAALMSEVDALLKGAAP